MSVQPLVLTRHFKAPPERLICSAIAFLDKFPQERGPARRQPERAPRASRDGRAAELRRHAAYMTITRVPIFTRP